MFKSITNIMVIVNDHFVGFDGTSPKGIDKYWLKFFKKFGSIEHLVTEHNDYEIICFRGNRFIISVFCFDTGECEDCIRRCKNRD